MGGETRSGGSSQSRGGRRAAPTPHSQQKAAHRRLSETGCRSRANRLRYPVFSRRERVNIRSGLRGGRGRARPARGEGVGGFFEVRTEAVLQKLTPRPKAGTGHPYFSCRKALVACRQWVKAHFIWEEIFFIQNRVWREGAGRGHKHLERQSRDKALFHSLSPTVFTQPRLTVRAHSHTEHMRL